MIRLLAIVCLGACALGQEQPRIMTIDGSVVVSLPGDDSTFAIRRPGSNDIEFPAAIEGILDSVAKTKTDVDEVGAAATALDKRASRVEREIGLESGSNGTQGGLGKILQAQLDLLTKMHSADVDAGKTTKNSEDLLEKLLKAGLATATASSKGGSKVEWVTGSSAAGMMKSFGTGTAIHVGGRGFITGMPIYQCKFVNGKDSSVTEPASAVRTDALSCPPAAWKGKFGGKTAIEVDMSVLEHGRTIPTVTGATSFKHSIMDTPPVIVKISRALPKAQAVACKFDGSAAACALQVAKKQDLNSAGQYKLDVSIRELDEGAINDATLHATSSDQSLVADSAIKFLKDGRDGGKRHVLVPLKKKGTVTITLVLKNKAGTVGVPVRVPIEFKMFSYVDPQGLLAYFPFNGGSDCEHTTAPSRITGKKVGGAQCRQSGGLVKGAGWFNNQDSMRMEYGGGRIKMGSKNWAVSVWIKTDTCYNNQIPLFFRMPGDGGCCINMIDHHAQVRFHGSGYGWFTYKSGSKCDAWNNKWQHHVYVSNGDARKFEVYVNGQIVGGTTNNNWRDLSNMYLEYVGARPSWGTNGLGGYIDELIMFKRRLSSTEARALYTMGTKKYEFADEL